MLYERRERRTTYDDPEMSSISEDKTFRVVPTGTGTLRLMVEEKGRAVAPEVYRRQLRDLERALVWALEPAEAKQKQRVEKHERRARERAELVDAVASAFEFRIAGRVTEEGRTLVRLEFTPDAEFKPRTRAAETFRHVRGRVWIEPASGQVARLEAEIVRDIALFGGVFGKIYRGGQFRLEQAPVVEEVWLPVRYEYRYSGRKFVFGFSKQEVTVASGYRRIGPPAEALAAVRHELRNAAAGGAAN
jgi:hypothetical protein